MHVILFDLWDTIFSLFVSSLRVPQYKQQTAFCTPVDVVHVKHVACGKNMVCGMSGCLDLISLWPLKIYCLSMLTM